MGRPVVLLVVCLIRGRGEVRTSSGVVCSALGSN